jgi:signal peptidase I
LNLDLALILTVLTLVSGIVVAVNRFVRPATEEPGGGESAWRTVVEYSRSFFPVLLFVLVIRSFVFEPFRIPSGSMMPTLLQGDFIFVKKYAYGLRLPVTETKILDTGEPERGDVIVFRLPSDTSINYIKRVVGLPGDRIEYAGHRLLINGEPVAVEKVDASGGTQYFEQLGERRHEILFSKPDYQADEGAWVVPDGQFFVMGDNRDNSKDSRYIEAIPESHLVGEAVRIWMHMDGLNWPRWDRIGTKIQ